MSDISTDQETPESITLNLSDIGPDASQMSDHFAKSPNARPPHTDPSAVQLAARNACGQSVQTFCRPQTPFSLPPAASQSVSRPLTLPPSMPEPTPSMPAEATTSAPSLPYPSRST